MTFVMSNPVAVTLVLLLTVLNILAVTLSYAPTGVLYFSPITFVVTAFVLFLISISTDNHGVSVVFLIASILSLLIAVHSFRCAISCTKNLHAILDTIDFDDTDFDDIDFDDTDFDNIDTDENDFAESDLRNNLNHNNLNRR